MIRQEDVYKIGRLGRAHGVKGEVSFMFDDDVFDRVDAEYLVLEVDGILTPFFMEQYRFRSDSLCLVKFCDIDSQSQASALTGCDVYFPRALAADCYDIIDSSDNAVVGRIASIDSQTANVLFELENGMLIPATDDLVISIDTDGRTIVMDLPKGLLEL